MLDLKFIDRNCETCVTGGFGKQRIPDPRLDKVIRPLFYLLADHAADVYIKCGTNCVSTNPRRDLRRSGLRAARHDGIKRIPRVVQESLAQQKAGGRVVVSHSIDAARCDKGSLLPTLNRLH